MRVGALWRPGSSSIAALRVALHLQGSRCTIMSSQRRIPFSPRFTPSRQITRKPQAHLIMDALPIWHPEVGDWEEGCRSTRSLADPAEMQSSVASEYSKQVSREMGSTKGKLLESKFFLDRLEESYLLHPDFGYFLSAFISSARSVFWVMRHEYGQVPGWQEWYSSLDLSNEHRVFLRKINKIRIRTTKKEPLMSNLRLSLHIPRGEMTGDLEAKLRGLQGETFRMTLRPAPEATTDQPMSRLNDDDEMSGSIQFRARFEEMFRFVGDFPDENILDVCKNYYDIIEKIVSECEGRFAINSLGASSQVAGVP